MLKLLEQQIGAENAFLPIGLHITCLLAEIVASCDCHGWNRSLRHTHTPTHPHFSQKKGLGMTNQLEQFIRFY